MKYRIIEENRQGEKRYYVQKFVGGWFSRWETVKSCDIYGADVKFFPSEIYATAYIEKQSKKHNYIKIVKEMEI